MKRIFEPMRIVAPHDVEEDLPTRLGVARLTSLFGGSGHTNTTSTSVPWSQQIPFLTEGFGAANDLFKNYNPQYYPSSTVAPFNQAQTTGLTGTESQATQGEPITGAAMNFGTGLENGAYLNADPGQSYFSNLAGTNQGLTGPGSGTLNDFASGKYVNSNQFTDPMAAQVMSQVIPQIESGFIGGDSYNNPAMAYAAAQGATSALAPIEYQNYAQQRQQQVGAAQAAQQGAISGETPQAAGASGLSGSFQDILGNMQREGFVAPSIQNMAYTDPSQMFQAGSQQQQQSQSQLTDLVNRFNYYQQLPYAKLNAFMGDVAGSYGGTTTQRDPYSINPLSTPGGAGALGLAGGLLGLI